ncbi:hypothetical protein D3C85_552610 [compost metagenome]
MEATLDVQDIAYCTLDIEGSRVPPTMNFVDSIFIQDGFAVAIPVLQLILNDERNTLAEEMNLVDGTLITIKIAKTREKITTRKFRVWGYKKQTTAKGPKLVCTAILDCPKWSAGVFTESVRGTSDSVIGAMASRAGLKYSGPPACDDVQTWLNVNKTRNAFSEDVAIRGYGSGQTCMYRLLTMDYEVRYRDLFAVLKGAPKWSFLQNTPEGAAKATPVVIRETQDASASGFATHMMNYGQKQYEHSLNEAGQLSTLTLDAPLLGKALPVNNDVRGQIAERGAKVNYTGFDTGTEPAPASNLHQNYEKAFYQNMRFLGLFSERVVLLSDECTEVTTFDCAEYQHSNQDNQSFKPSAQLGGNWLVGGKTQWIKAGHKFSEVYYLYRAALMETGSTATAGGNKSNSQQNAKANEGNVDLAGEQAAQDNAAAASAGAGTPAINNATTAATSAGAVPKSVPSAVAAKSTLEKLKEHALVSKAQSIIPLSQNGVGNSMLASQDGLRSAVKQYAQTSGPLRDQLDTGSGIGTLDGWKVLKKYGGSTINALANAQKDPRRLASEIERIRNNPDYLKTQAIQTVTKAGSDVTGVRLHNVVSAASGRKVGVGAIVGDVLNGGLWAKDLREAGLSPNQIKLPIPDVLSEIENPALLFGGEFLHNATGVGLNSNNILINPYSTARNIEKWSTSTNPQKLLVDSGARAYINTFGHISPKEAETSMADIGKLAGEVAVMYGKNSVLTDSSLTDRQLKDLGKDVAFTFGDPSIVPVVNQVTRVVDYGTHHDITTTKSLVTWADYYSMGTKTADAVGQWKIPLEFPGEPIAKSSVTNGNTTQFDESTQKWMQS